MAGEKLKEIFDLRHERDRPSREGRATCLRAALADVRPLALRLLAFLLEDAGVRVVGEAATELGCIRLVTDRRPDVLFVNATVPVDANALAAIRAGSPTTKIVVLSAPLDVPAARARWIGADAIVPEDAPVELVLKLVTRLCRAPAVEDGGAGLIGSRHRVWGFVAASIVILAMVIGAGWLSTAPPRPAPPPVARNELHVAFAALHDLVGAIRDGSPSALADAQRLAGSWARAAEAGGDVSGLLDEIRAQVPRALRAVASNAQDHRGVDSGGHGKHLGRAKHPDVGHGSGARHGGNGHGSSDPRPPKGHGRSAAAELGATQAGHAASSRGQEQGRARHASRASAGHGRPS